MYVVSDPPRVIATMARMTTTSRAAATITAAVGERPKIVVLPLRSLSFIENGGEFRKVGWSVAPDYQPLPILSAIDERRSDGKLAREFSAAHEIPDLQKVQIARPLTSLHKIAAPDESATPASS